MVEAIEPDEHEKSELRTEREILKEHAKHFLDKIEAIITIGQWQ